MFVITGATGRVGGVMARSLRGAGAAVRAVLRDPARGGALRDHGCEVVGVAPDDAAALAAAFRDAEGVFVLPPPVFDPAPGYPEARRFAATMAAALREARPARVVSLSTVGADAREDNLLSQHTIVEAALSDLPCPITFLRAAWFMDNVAWDVPAARQKGVLKSFLQPLDRAIPMVAAGDVGATAAALIRERWSGIRVVGLQGPEPVSPNRIARALAGALSRPVRAEAVPRDTWEALFAAHGMANPLPRMRMLDGFNEGWLRFSGEEEMRKGATTIETVVEACVGAG